MINEAIYRFFRDHYSITPFSDISDSQLEKKLRTWLQSSDLDPAKIKRYFSNESYKESILSQVKFAFSNIGMVKFYQNPFRVKDRLLPLIQC